MSESGDDSSVEKTHGTKARRERTLYIRHEINRIIFSQSSDESVSEPENSSSRKSNDWRHRAACKPGSGVIDTIDVFFEGNDRESYTGDEKVWMEKAAKAVCARCVVTIDCLQFAVDNDEFFGVWGGQSQDERAAQRRRRQMS